MIVVLTGVSGAGKSTLGAALASRIDAEFLDADDFWVAEKIARIEQVLADYPEARWIAGNYVNGAVDGSRIPATKLLEANIGTRLAGSLSASDRRA